LTALSGSSDRRGGERGVSGNVLGLIGKGRHTRPLDVEPARRASGVTAAAAGHVPVHLLVDSTGLRLCGPGEWLVEKQGSHRRRAWRKLHLGTDANTGQIVAAELTTHDIDDGSQVGPLLEQVARPVASFTGDGAYDRDDVYSEVTKRHPDAAVIVPPRSVGVPSAAAETTPTLRDRHLQLIAKRGRIGWQRICGYNWRASVEADIGRFKRVIGDALRCARQRWPSLLTY
jgi:hypothetical protein